MSPAIPVLETDRLILRGWRPGDLDAYAAIRAEPSVARWTIGGKPLERPVAWQKLLQHCGHWGFCGYGFWAVEEKSTGAMLGETGFIDMQRDYAPAVNGIPEIGWIIAPAAQGKGYATEAAKAAVQWGKDHFGPIRVLAAVNVENLASIRVAEKCGFKECLRRDFNGRSAVFLDRIL